MNELRVTYIQNYNSNTPLSYFKGDNSWIGMYTRMRTLLTPEILYAFLHHHLGISLSESVIEAILAYPDSMDSGKDVTVVFTY